MTKRQLKDRGVLAGGKKTMTVYNIGGNPSAEQIERDIIALNQWKEREMREARAIPEKRLRDDFLEWIRNKHWDQYQKLLSKLRQVTEYRTHIAHNLVVEDGLKTLAQVVLDESGAPSGKITHCAVGDDSTNVDAADTQLGNEIARNAISGSNRSGSEAFFSTFFGQNDFNDTVEEVGHFIDGSASANSGTLYSRIEDSETNELPVSKDGTQSLTVDYKSPFNAA